MLFLAVPLMIVLVLFFITRGNNSDSSSDSSVVSAESNNKVTTSFSSSDQATLTDSSNGAVQLYSNLFKKSDATLPSGTTVTITQYLLTSDNVVYGKFAYNGKTYYVAGKNISLIYTNAVNVAVENLNFPESTVSKKIYSDFEKKKYKTTSKKPKGIVIHDTGTEYSTLDSEIDYMESSYDSDGVFVHTFIDDTTIENIANTNYMAQGAGSKANPYYIQFELVHVYTADAFAKEMANAAYYTALMLREYGLGVTLGDEDGSGTLWTHDMVSSYLGGTDHTDPVEYWSDSAATLYGSTYTIENFKALVLSYYLHLDEN